MLYSKIQGQGKPLLILHGFLGMSDNWKTLATQFAQEGFQVHAIDLRNHGRSFHSDDFSYALMVSDIVDYCKQYHLESVNLIGHSMGGKVAMLFATSLNNWIDKLVVVDIGPKYYPVHHQTIMKGLNAIDFRLKPSRTDVDVILSKYITEEGTKQFLLKNLYWLEPDQLAFRFNLKALTDKIENIGEALEFEKKYEKEVLFLRGDQSDYILDSDFETIYHHFPKAKIDTVVNASHWLHADNPIVFLNKTISFLKNNGI